MGVSLGKYQRRVELKMTDEMYGLLLSEADGDPKNLQKVIRSKLEAFQVSSGDAKVIRAQQDFMISMLQRIIVDHASVHIRTLSRLIPRGEKKEDRDARTKKEEGRMADARIDKLAMIEQLRKEAGL